MAHLTDNFTSEGPLSPAVRSSIAAAFDEGWADPKKRSQAAGRAALLQAAAKEEIAELLGTRPDRLEIIGEPALLHLLTINGFMKPGRRLHSTHTAVGKARAVFRSHPAAALHPVDSAGISSLSPQSLGAEDIFYLQAVNGETGVVTELDPWRDTSATVLVDATKSLPEIGLCNGFAATVFDATSWSGPAGVGLININDAGDFTYPLPHISPIRVPGSYSLPLLIGAAVALSENHDLAKKYLELRNALVTALSPIDGVDVVAGSQFQSRYLSIVIKSFAAEEVLTELLKDECAIDAGSACSPEDLAPSHVIAAMGYPTEGHLRFTIHPNHSLDDLTRVAEKLKKVLKQLGS